MWSLENVKNESPNHVFTPIYYILTINSNKILTIYQLIKSTYIFISYLPIYILSHPNLYTYILITYYQPQLTYHHT